MNQLCDPKGFYWGDKERYGVIKEQRKLLGESGCQIELGGTETLKVDMSSGS